VTVRGHTTRQCLVPSQTSWPDRVRAPFGTQNFYKNETKTKEQTAYFHNFEGGYSTHGFLSHSNEVFTKAQEKEYQNMTTGISYNSPIDPPNEIHTHIQSYLQQETFAWFGTQKQVSVSLYELMKR
jgi:hypothetical protein